LAGWQLGTGPVDNFFLWHGAEYGILSNMTTLAEIKTAADALSDTEKQQLMLHLVARLKAQGASLPETPLLPFDRAGDWMAEDEATMRRFHPSA
jgi:hypothetical protein